MDIYSKLSDLEHKYEDIVHELSLEGAANDTKRFTELCKRQGELEPIVSTYSKYKQNKDLEAESLEILSTEKDPDMIAMAKEELSTARANMTELENELKILLIPKDPNDGTCGKSRVRARGSCIICQQSLQNVFPFC